MSPFRIGTARLWTRLGFIGLERDEPFPLINLFPLPRQKFPLANSGEVGRRENRFEVVRQRIAQFGVLVVTQEPLPRVVFFQHREPWHVGHFGSVVLRPRFRAIRRIELPIDRDITPAFPRPLGPVFAQVLGREVGAFKCPK